MEKTIPDVPYIVHEGIMARQERIIKRLATLLIISVLVIFATNFIWLWYWNQYEYIADETVTVDGKNGIANYIGNDGDITNGTGGSAESPQSS